MHADNKLRNGHDAYRGRSPSPDGYRERDGYIEEDERITDIRL
jgi:hypothetical protein